jgi:hypothetical protein
MGKCPFGRHVAGWYSFGYDGSRRWQCFDPRTSLVIYDGKRRACEWLRDAINEKLTREAEGTTGK